MHATSAAYISLLWALALTSSAFVLPTWSAWQEELGSGELIQGGQWISTEQSVIASVATLNDKEGEFLLNSFFPFISVRVEMA
jgi:hypothetical protein